MRGTHHGRARSHRRINIFVNVEFFVRNFARRSLRHREHLDDSARFDKGQEPFNRMERRNRRAGLRKHDHREPIFRPHLPVRQEFRRYRREYRRRHFRNGHKLDDGRRRRRLGSFSSDRLGALQRIFDEHALELLSRAEPPRLLADRRLRPNRIYDCRDDPDIKGGHDSSRNAIFRTDIRGDRISLG